MPKVSPSKTERVATVPDRALVESTIAGLIVAVDRLMEQKESLKKQLDEVERQISGFVDSHARWTDILDTLPRESGTSSSNGPPRGGRSTIIQEPEDS